MRFSQLIWSLLPLTASLAGGASLPEVEKRAGCTNGPTSRNCWSDGFDINTDADLSWPTTGKTVTYNFEITNTTCNPDGHGPVICLLVNNQYPGPTIRYAEKEAFVGCIVFYSRSSDFRAVQGQLG